MNTLWKRKILNLDLLEGFFYYKNLIYISLIGKELRTQDDYLSRLESILDDPLPIDYSLTGEQLDVINASHNTPWYAHYANYIVAKYTPPSFTYQ